MPERRETWLACHGPLSCNSGQHVRALAVELAGRGHAVAVCVPERSAADGELPTVVPVRTFAEVVRQPGFAPPRLVHLWTPRERMRAFLATVTARFGAPPPHVVHLEDSETHLLAGQMGLGPHEIAEIRDGLRPLVVPDHLMHPFHGDRLLATAAGVTALAERLVADLPHDVPAAVFLPGFDPMFAGPRPAAARTVRARLGIPAGTAIVTYTGNVHAANVAEVRSLLVAVALVNRRGLPLTLIRTGLDHVPLAEHGLDVLRGHVIDLGLVPRVDLPDLVHAADVLVQPGRVDEWNACRLPSKLPDFLISGRPVILPAVNLGTRLEHGHEAIVLPEATAERIAAALLEWLPQRERLAAIGAAGAAFARRALTWSAAADAVETLYDRLPS
ncbi:MAG: glycosyltransferase [Pirellulales bacterium]